MKLILIDGIMIKSFRRFHNWNFLFIALLCLNFGAIVAMENSGRTDDNIPANVTIQNQNVTLLWKQALDLIVALRKQLCIGMESIAFAFTNKKCIKEGSKTLLDTINEMVQSAPNQHKSDQFDIFKENLASLSRDDFWVVGPVSEKKIQEYKDSLANPLFDDEYKALFEQKKCLIDPDQMQRIVGTLKDSLDTLHKGYKPPREFETLYKSSQLEALVKRIKKLESSIRTTYFGGPSGEITVNQIIKTEYTQQIKSIIQDIDVILAQYGDALSERVQLNLSDFKKQCKPAKNENFWSKLNNSDGIHSFKQNLEFVLSSHTLGADVSGAINSYHPKLKINAQSQPPPPASQLPTQATTEAAKEKFIKKRRRPVRHEPRNVPLNSPELKLLDDVIRRVRILRNSFGQFCGYDGTRSTQVTASSVTAHADIALKELNELIGVCECNGVLDHTLNNLKATKKFVNDIVSGKSFSWFRERNTFLTDSDDTIAKARLSAYNTIKFFSITAEQVKDVFVAKAAEEAIKKEELDEQHRGQFNQECESLLSSFIDIAKKKPELQSAQGNGFENIRGATESLLRKLPKTSTVRSKLLHYVLSRTPKNKLTLEEEKRFREEDLPGLQSIVVMISRATGPLADSAFFMASHTDVLGKDDAISTGCVENQSSKSDLPRSRTMHDIPTTDEKENKKFDVPDPTLHEKSTIEKVDNKKRRKRAQSSNIEREKPSRPRSRSIPPRIGQEHKVSDKKFDALDPTLHEKSTIEKMGQEPTKSNNTATKRQYPNNNNNAWQAIIARALDNLSKKEEEEQLGILMDNCPENGFEDVIKRIEQRVTAEQYTLPQFISSPETAPEFIDSTDKIDKQSQPPLSFFSKYALPAAICAGTACAAFAAYTYRNEIQTHLLPSSWQQSALIPPTPTSQKLLK